MTSASALEGGGGSPKSTQKERGCVDYVLLVKKIQKCCGHNIWKVPNRPSSYSSTSSKSSDLFGTISTFRSLSIDYCYLHARSERKLRRADDRQTGASVSAVMTE